MTPTTTRITPPGTIVAAFFGYLVATATLVVSVVMLLGAREELEAALRASDTTGMTPDQLEDAARFAQLVAVGIAALIALVYLWLAFKLKAGRNWARVTLTLFTVLQVAALFATEGNTTAGYAGGAVAVLALVLSYLPPSNEYVAFVKQGR
jgi:hypothetical protein